MLADPNKPSDEPVDTDREDAWTEGKGLYRAVWQALVTTLLASVLLWPIAWYVPNVLLNGILRAFLGFLLAWTMFSITQRAAGMVGIPISAIVVVASCLVLLSNHFVFALHGVTGRDGLIAGWIWFNPVVLAFSNGTALIGIGLCAAIRHNGSGDLNTLIEIFTRNIWGSRR